MLICCLYVTVCHVSLEAFCAHAAHTLTFHVLSCCCRCFLTVCLSHFLILFYRPSDAARCHHAAVTASAGAITGHTHHGKHTRTHAFIVTHHTCRGQRSMLYQPCRCLLLLLLLPMSCSDDSGLCGRPQCEIR